MGKPKAPKPPDPRVTAEAQTGTNVSTALANARLQNVNQYGPDGSKTYSVSGYETFTDPTSGATYQIPIYNETTQLSAAQQAIKGQTDTAELNLGRLAASQSGRLNDLLGRPFDPSTAPARGDVASLNAGSITRSYGTDFSQDRQRVENALMQRLNPSLEADSNALRTRLANQGLQPGSVAYNRAVDESNRASADARLGAILAGGQEQSRLVDMEAQRAAFQNTAQQQQFGQNLSRFDAQNSNRAQSLQEQYAERNQPINEISALLSGAQVNMPQFGATNSPQMPTVDYAGLVNENYNQRLGIHNQQMANRQSILGGLFGLGGKLIGLSDMNMKDNVRRVGTLDNGLPIYAYTYKGSQMVNIGVMAQDVAGVNPDAVRDIGGTLYVDYGKAVEAA